MNFRKIVSLILGIVLAPSLCFANAGVPMIFIELPMMVVLLIPIILIETQLIKKFADLKFKKALGLITKANLISTLIGFPLSWLLHFLAELGFSYLRYWTDKIDYSFFSETFYQNNELIMDILAVIVMAPWLGPIEDKLHWMIPLAGFISLIPAFFVTILFEYKYLKNKISPSKGTLKTSIIVINLYSYTLLAFVWIGQLFYNIHKFNNLNREIFIFPFSLFN